MGVNMHTVTSRQWIQQFFLKKLITFSLQSSPLILILSSGEKVLFDLYTSLQLKKKSMYIPCRKLEINEGHFY